ncbi:MAG: REP element-mobilizing transposase RayT [Roseivirga sp.]|jgi:putative transposase
MNKLNNPFLYLIMEPRYVQFFTATVVKWRLIFFNSLYKSILLESLTFLTTEKRVKVYGFVIMPNHIHLIWQVQQGHELKNVQRDFMKFTSQQIQKDMRANHPDIHQTFEVNLKDRKYQIWKRNPLSIELYSREVIEQKLDYVHNNPVQGKWMLSDEPSNYIYSSASFYEKGKSHFKFLTHYMEYFGN